jgi:hypothetical protein
MDTRSVRRLCDQLEAAGHLQVIASRGRGHSCRYRPILHAEPDQNEPEREAESEPEPVDTAIDAPAPEPQDGELFPDTADTAPKPAPRTKQDLTADFEAFWTQYPRRVSKGAARKAYDKARKSATADELELGAMRYAAVRSSEDPTYTKHPSTWLNNKCWLDEPEPARGANFGASPRSQQPRRSYIDIALGLGPARREGLEPRGAAMRLAPATGQPFLSKSAATDMRSGVGVYNCRGLSVF